MTGRAPGHDAADFARLVLRILDEGRTTGTQKLVLLLALVSEVERVAGETGHPVRELSLDAVCDRVVDVLWQQVAPYVPPAGDAAVIPRQMQYNGRGSQVLARAVRDLRERAERADRFSAAEARELPAYVSHVRPRLRRALIANPLKRLQTLRSGRVEFVYRNEDWRQLDGIRLLPGVAEHLVRLGPVLRPVIEQKYVELVATYNGWGEHQVALRGHLFGVDRRTFPTKVRQGLLDMHDGACFYCGAGLSIRACHLDHFIPWRRISNDAVENLVPSCRRCNGAKSVHLSEHALVRRWYGSIRLRTDLGVELERDLPGVFSDQQRTKSIAWQTYWAEHDDTLLWSVDPLRRPRLGGQRDAILRELRPE